MTIDTPEQIEAHAALEAAKATKRADQVLAYTAGLHRLADWLERHPDIVNLNNAVSIVRVAWSPDELASMIKAAGGGDKYATDDYIGVERKFGPHSLKVISYRSTTCEPVPTGEVKEATREIDPAKPVPDGARNVRTRTITVYEVDEPVVEWVCPPSLIDTSGASHDDAQG